MNKYRKVIKPKEDVVKDEEEIRVTAAGSVSAYVSRAAKLFSELDKSYVTIVATGNALTKAVTAAEVIKRRFKGLHQITKLGSQDIIDEYEPLEEGLDKVSEARKLPIVEIKLSKEALDTSDKGYQPPVDESEVKEFDAEELMKSRGRGRGRGKGKSGGKGAGKGKGKGKGGEEGEPSSKGKGKGKGKSAEAAGKGKGKGKSETPAKGKGKGKSVDDAPAKGKGKAKGKDAPKGKGKAKGKVDEWDSYPPARDSYPPARKGGKSKSKGKGKSNYWEEDDWYSYDAYDYGHGSGKGKSKDKGKEKGKDKGKGKGKDKGKEKGKGKGKSKGKGKNDWNDWY